MDNKNLLIGMILLAISSSCMAIPSHHRLYSGSALLTEQVAFLTNYCQTFTLGAHVRIVSIDGKEKDNLKGSIWDRTIKIELLPGLHEVEVRYVHYMDSRKIYSQNNLFLKFYAEPGHTYCIYENLSGMTWSPVISDITGK